MRDDPPRNPHLPILAELPPGVAEQGGIFAGPLREARGNGKHYHYCTQCRGWIEGWPTEYREYTLAPLSGRAGVARCCLRCAWELDFSGMVS